MHRYLDTNRALWNEWTPIHAQSESYNLEGFKKGGVRLRPYEIEDVGSVVRKSLLHLQCHFGLDTLSWARLGARATGVDFSERSIDLARSLAAELDLDATFIYADVLSLRDVLDGEFDIVYTSRGVLGWLPDLFRWAQVVAHFLRPGGIFYITESHPFTQVWDDDAGVTELRLRYPYFERPEPLECAVHGSYADREAPVHQSLSYQWVHSLGGIVTAIAHAGLHIEFLHEFPYLDWGLPFLVRSDDGLWRLPAAYEGEIPLMFSLKARKPGSSNPSDDPSSSQP